MSKKKAMFFNQGGGSVTFETEYQAILDESTELYGVGSLPSPAHQIIQNAKVASAKASGIWALADRIFVFTESGSPDFKKINWKNPTSDAEKILDLFNATRGEGTGFVYSDTGIKGDGYRYMDLRFNPVNTGTQLWQLDDAGMYVNIVTASVLYDILIATVGTGNNSKLTYQANQTRINNTNTSLQMTYTLDPAATGLFGASRTGLTTATINLDTTTTDFTGLDTAIVSNSNLSMLGWSWSTAADWTSGDAEIGYVILGRNMSAQLADIKTAFD